MTSSAIWLNITINGPKISLNYLNDSITVFKKHNVRIIIKNEMTINFP